jgi:hypothetical protein
VDGTRTGCCGSLEYSFLFMRRQNLLEAISRLGFSFEISRRRAGQEREAEDQPTGILKYVEDLRRRLNADIGQKDFFEMASKKFLQALWDEE